MTAHLIQARALSGAVAGAMAGAAVSIRLVRRTRTSARTHGDSSPGVSVGDGHATVAGAHSTIVQAFTPPAAPQSSADVIEWVSEARRAVSAADHAYKLLNRPDLAFEAADGLIDPADVHRDALDAQRSLHAAGLGAPTETIYDVLDTMERRLQGAANGFAFAFNHLVQNSQARASADGRAAIQEVLAEGLSKLENGEIRRGHWTDELTWVEMQGRLESALRSLQRDGG